jgi:group II intron reverse transcriptase/maturase
VAQRAIVMVLEPIYEQDFHACCYGFRPGRSAHEALHELYGVITRQEQYWVLDVDIRNYFDSIPHPDLRAILDQRVTDGVIRRMIDKWLKAGVPEDGLLRLATEGTPQGGVISPMLSNIFLHHVLDEWVENPVKPRLAGPCTLIRFADDFLMTFKNHRDAKRVLDVLAKRLGRYGLTLHPNKIRFIDFRPERQGGMHPDCKGPPFDFLGFTHTWVKSQKGKNVVRQRMAKSRLARCSTGTPDCLRSS